VVPPAASLPSPVSNESPALETDGQDDPTESVDWRERVNAALQRHAAWLACVKAKGHNCSEEAAPDPMESLLKDETLVNGDIVSTPTGFKVFRGQSNVPHSLADFEPAAPRLESSRPGR
jgi:hypothetical protein